MSAGFPDTNNALRTVSPAVRTLMLLLARRHANRDHGRSAGAASLGDAEQAQGAAEMNWLREQLIRRLRDEIDHSET